MAHGKDLQDAGTLSFAMLDPMMPPGSCQSEANLHLANELGVEEEIWFLEYHQPQLAIWRRKRPRQRAMRLVPEQETGP
jgi:hypothetical protein